MSHWPVTCIDTGEVCINYEEYLKSNHWQLFRKRYYASKSAVHECYRCGAKGVLHLHHKTYERIGREWLKDVVPLCPDCHKAVHAGEPLFSYREWNKKIGISSKVESERYFKPRQRAKKKRKKPFRRF